MTLDSKIYKTLGVVGAIALVHSLHTVHSKYESYMAERVAYERDQLSSEVKRLEQITDFSSLQSDVLLDARRKRIVKEEVEKANRKPGRNYKITEEQIFRIITQESNCNMCARSNKDALGIMQILRSTARSEYGITIESEIFNLENNIYMGTDYFSMLVNRYKGNFQLAYAAYYAGPGAVDQHGGVPAFAKFYVESLSRETPQASTARSNKPSKVSQSRKAIARAEPAKRSKVTASSKKAKARVYALTHYVNQGETLWSISRAYQVPISDIARLNGVNSNYRVRTNQPLKIPTKRRG